MIKLFLRIYDTLAPRRRLVGGVVCLLVLLCGVLAGRMAYDEDISAFMPLDEETAKYAEVFNKLGGQERVVVIFEDEGQPDFSTLEAAMTVFGESVERRDTARLAKNLQVRVDEQGMLETLEGVWRTYPLLLNEEDYARLDTLLADAAYPARQMDRNRQALMLPTGGFVARSLPYDPLNMSGGVTNRLRSLNVGDAYQTIDGYLFKDSVGLVMLESPFGISESGNNQRLQALLDSCMADVRSAYPSLSVSAVGAPLIAVTNAERIKADSLLALGLSVTLILLILLYAFRRVGDLLWVGVSVFVGWLFALGAIALAREGISLIVIGIGSVIIGIAVNYPLHFIEHLKHETDMREALKEMVSPLLVGNITTVSAFLCLVALDAKAMRDLGLFGSLTLVGTILFVLICLPLFLKPRGETRPEGGFSPGRVSLPRTGPGRRVAFWVVAGLTVVFGYFSTGTSFDSDMRNINYMLPEQREGLRFLASTLESEGDSARTLYAVAEGRTLDEALRRSEALVEEARGVKGVGRIVGITGLLPSDSSRERRIAQWSAFWTRHAAARDGLARAATAAGFSPTAFEPFGEMVERPAETLAGDLSQSPLYDLVGSHFILRSDSVYRVVNFVRAEGGGMEEALAERLPAGCFVFSSADVSNHLAERLSESFNYIGFVCGFVVFAFLWLSFGSIELSLLAFLPLAVSWVWILGIMGILGMQFNIVNIILATFIFGQGDDYTIFITEGLMYEYTTGRRRLARYKDSVALSALLMLVALGTLIFSEHPAMRSLAEVAIVGMATVVVMAYYLPPLVFRWLTEKGGRRREYPITLSRLAYSLFSISFFIGGMFLLLIPYTRFIHKPLQRFWHGEAFYHELLRRIARFVVYRVPGVRFRTVNEVGEKFDRPAVIICNHQSHLDAMAVMQLSPRVVVLTNDWAWSNPFYGLVIHTAEFYPVSNGYDRNFPHLQDLARRGYSIVVFPEGTRTPDGEIGRFHKGAFTLAKALGIDILPLYLHGFYDVLPKHDFMLRRGSATLEVGRRLAVATIQATDDRLLTRQVYHHYQAHYAAMRQRLETAEYRAPYEAYRRKYKLDL